MHAFELRAKLQQHAFLRHCSLPKRNRASWSLPSWFVRTKLEFLLFLSHNNDDYSYSTFHRASQKVLHEDDKQNTDLIKDKTKT